MKVQEVTPDSNTSPLLAGAQFADAFRIDVEGTGLNARHAIVLMTRPTGWIDALTGLRNLLMAPFGLKTSGETEVPRRETIGLFPILTESPERLVAGFNDKHLDFRLVVDVAARGTDSASGQQVTATTLVKTHNLFGRIYLATILPFHRLIVPTLLRKIAAD
jgi:Protein of unknown function (DUF2867)